MVKKMKKKEMLARIIEELVRTKEEVRRLKRQINEMNDTLESLVPEKKLITEEEWEMSIGNTNATFEVPFEQPLEARTSDVEVKDEPTSFSNESTEEYLKDKYGDGK